MFLLFVIAQSIHAQTQTPLFLSTEALNLQATGSVKAIKKNTNDSTFVSAKFQYEVSPGNWMTIPTEARTRGNFRLRYCYFPPLKLKFKKTDIASTVFEGNKSLKLVIPCLRQSNMNELIRREYLCYKFYEALSAYHFKTRLVNLRLTEVSKKKESVYDLLGFLVEDNSSVAKRSAGKIMEVKGLNPDAFEEKQAVRNDYFQYMIGNADWSAVYQHNTNVLFAEGKYITLSYDFDMSGFVNASYAQANPPNLGTGDPRERVYRGFCRSARAMEEIRQEYINNEDRILSIVKHESSHFTDYEVRDMINYLQEFFDILRNDHKFKESILSTCRTENRN